MLQCIYRGAAVYFFAATVLAGQSPSGNWNTVRTTLALGTRVRIEITGQRATRGRIESVTEDSLVLTTAKSSRQTFPRQQIVRISERKDGHRARNTLIGAGVGAAAGLGIGLAADRCKQFCFVSPGVIRGTLAAAGALVGAIVGVVLPTGGWKEIYRQ